MKTYLFILLGWMTQVTSSRTTFSRINSIHQNKNKIIICCLSTREAARLQSYDIQILKLRDPPQASEPKCIFHNATSYLNTGPRFYSKNSSAAKCAGLQMQSRLKSLPSESKTAVQSKTLFCLSEPFLPSHYIWPTSMFN